MELNIRTKHASVSTPRSLLDKQDGIGSYQPSPPLPAPQCNIVKDS